MDELINTVNKLQDVFSASGCAYIDLPQIAVIGSQSSGKSSVLEHILGKSLLPRGAGIVTRCPLVLQMVPAEGEAEEYAIFQHDKTKVFTDCGLIKREIEQQTGRLAGPGKGVCQDPIHLRMYSPSFLTLTLVDLPGLTKVPVGDQPRDIEEQTKNLTLTYIKNPNSIILAVIPGNADMATSDSLKLAREVDPEGSRTLAVITKLDLMDDGTDAWDMLTGKVIPVKLGIVGVVNRSQKDIMDEKSIRDSLIEEAEFFNKKYKSIASTHGSPYLTKKVQSLLKNHVRDCLPPLREWILQKRSIKYKELQQIGESSLDKSSLLLDLVTKFSNTYTSSVKGNMTDIQTKELYGGARIRYVFQECFTNALKSIDGLAGLTRADILTAMENASGVVATLFVSEVAFELLIKKQIERLRNPCLECVDLVYKELIRLMYSCVEDQNIRLDRFPKLKKELLEVVTDLLQNQVPSTRQMVECFIDVQLAYINTSHPEFLPNTFTRHGGDGDDKSILFSRKRSVTAAGSREEDKASRDYALIQKLISSYFCVVRGSVQDTVPKIVMHLLVNFVLEHLQLELVARLYKRDTDDLLQEAQLFCDKRRELKAEVQVLEQAVQIIDGLKADMSGRPDNEPVSTG